MGYIYLRTNLINGKKYVGQTVDIERRNRQWKNLNRKYGGVIIERARAKYGTDGFSFELLKECQDKDMNYWEMYYVKMYNSKKPYGYNSTDGGDSTYERSDETKAKLSAALKGKPKPKVSAALKGRKRPDIAEAHRGKKQSEETIEKRVAKLRGKPNPKLADALKGRKQSDETKKKIGNANRGRKRPDVAAAQRGKKRPAEAVAKSAAALSKVVQALDKNDNVVMEFPSTKEAGRQGFNQGAVAACCRGERKSHKGFIWRWKSV